MEVDPSPVWNVNDQLCQKNTCDLISIIKKDSDLDRLCEALHFDDFIKNPIKVIDDLYAQRTDLKIPLPVADFDKKVLNCLHLNFLERRSRSERVANVACLNDPSVLTLKNGQVVSFRCMIQDWVGNEFSVVETTENDPITGEPKSKSTLLRDVLEIDYESAHGQGLIEKEVLLGISPPGENAWVSRISETEELKRNENKRSKVEDEQSCTDSVLNLPDYAQAAPWLFCNHKDSKPMASFLKMYKTADIPKQNEIVEVTGIISVPDGEIKRGDESEEVASLLPGTSKFPVIHVFSCLKLGSGNPRIPIIEGKLLPMFDTVKYNAKHCADVLRDLVSLSLGGDRYASVYAMISLVSRIVRRDSICSSFGQGVIGKLVLNISGVGTPETKEVPQLFQQLLQSLMPRTLLLELTLDNMSSWNLIPKKNLSTDQLEPGLFQMCDGTVVLINELNLQEGKLNDTGARNVGALKELLDEQQVKYNYTYQYPTMFTDCPVISLSKDPSILKCDLPVTMKPDSTMTPDKFRLKFQSLLEENAPMLQNYLSFLRSLSFANSPLVAEDSLSDDLEAFFQARNEPDAFKSKMTGHDFSAFIMCCRLWCLLNGDLSITREGFMFMKEVEHIRDCRVVIRKK